MRNTSLIAVFGMGMIAAALLHGQTVPTTINYQGRLTDNTPTQTPVNATTSMQFEIWDAAAIAADPDGGATRLWREPNADGSGVSVTVTGGIFSYTLGATVPILPAVFSSGGPRYLQIIINPGASQEILTPRQLITATGYTNLAENSNSALTATTATSADNALNLGGQPAANYLLTSATAFDSSRLGGSLASAWQKALATPACAGNQFLTTVNPDGTTSCGAPSSFTGSLSGDVTGAQPATVVASVGGQTAASVSAGTVLANNATNLNTAGAIVKRDGSGNFTAGTITAALSGNATTATALAGNGSNCPAGQYARGTDAAGNVEGCSTAVASAPPFSIATLDAGGDVGYYTSIAIGSDGLGLISYLDVTNYNLKVAHCVDVACTSASLTTLDSTGFVGSHSSIVIGSDGLGLISYLDESNLRLKVAHCSNVACTSATLAVLDSGGVLGQYTSITIGIDGLGLISYYDQTNGNLKVAHCANVVCSSATLATLDTVGNVGIYTSITIGGDGLGLISYQDFDNGALKVAHCSNAACSSATLAALDTVGNVGYYTSITTGSDGLGLISYYDQGSGYLKVAHCANASCSTETLATLDTVGNVGAYSSITLGNDGLGLISYYDSTNGDLKVARCTNVACSSATIVTLDTAGNVGRDTSITIGSDGMGLISYYEITNGDLKVAHYSNAASLSSVQTFTGTNTFTSTITGSISGNAATATALAANGANCTAGTFPLGVNATGNVEGCATANSSITAPFTLSGTLAGTVISATNNGTGHGVYGQNTGTGRAGFFEITNPASTTAALYAGTTGTGPAAAFAGNVTITGKATSAATIAADASTTLTTKGYVENRIVCTRRSVTAGAGLFTATATCVAGETLTGGGCNVGTGTMVEGYPLSLTQFSCRDTIAADITAYAICCTF